MLAPLFAQGAPEASSSEESGQNQAQPVLEIDLNQAYERALTASEADLIQSQDLRIAQARYRQSMAGFFPSIGLFAQQTWQDEYDRDETRELVQDVLRQTDPNTARLLPQSSSPSDSSGLNPFQGGVSLSWPLFTGFRTYHESRAYEADRRASRLDRARFRELLYLDVADVFYQALLYERTLEILETESRALRQRIGELVTRVRLGRSRDGELLSARSDLQTNLVEQENTRGLLRTSRELLAFLINYPADRITLLDHQELPDAGQLEAYLTETEDRADVLAAISRLRASQERLSEAHGEYLPEISLEGEYYLRQRPDYGRDWRVVLRIDLPLFEGGVTSARSAEARAVSRRSELELERLKRSASYEVRSAYSDFTSAAARTVLLEESVRLARLNYGVQRRDYGLGIVTNLEVLSALARIQEAERSLLQARLQAKLAHIRLHLAAGRSPT
ncbi:MAG: TolC family protein [Spirochaetales bacterium]|nr:TolC family protein [Leptospiraceae bacterium]MCP5482082.1 TolC family protein [Spirochaetales bacterium]MCP5484962.1 TolC family protein [Spirochaetales bacterium]